MLSILTPTDVPSPDLKAQALLGRLRSRPVVALPKCLCNANGVPVINYRRVIALPGEQSRSRVRRMVPLFGTLIVPPVPIDINITPLSLQPCIAYRRVIAPPSAHRRNVVLPVADLSDILSIPFEPIPMTPQALPLTDLN